MKDKMNVKKSLLKAMATVAEIEMEVNLNEGPPICIGLLYQPKRPMVYVERGKQ